MSEEKPGLTNKQQAFIEAYLRCWNASEAARQAGYRGDPNTIGPRLLANVGVKAAVEQRLAALQMSTDEILVGLTQQARGDLGQFFKIVEEWTFYPLPSYEIIDAKEVTDDRDPEHPVTRVSYWVRHIVIDLDKVIDPRYSHLLQEFTDSPKDGLGIKIYSKQTALQTLARIRGMITSKAEITGKDGKPIQFEDVSLTDEQRAARIAALLDNARARKGGQDAN